MSLQSLPASLLAAQKPAQRFNCADTAKLVRKALKEAFPEIKFSVRSSTYAGGASISVGWTDGPLSRHVDPIIKVFAGSGFDGMQDLKYFRSLTMGGAPVSFGADFVSGSREISKARIDALEAILVTIPKDLWLTVAVEMGDPSPCSAVDHAHDAKHFAWILLANCGGADFEDRRSALADSVMVVDENRNEI